MNGPTSKSEEQQTITDKEAEFLDWIEQQYLVHGGIPTEESAVESGSVSSQFYRKCFRKQLFRDALTVRGIVLRGLDGPDSGKLTEKQLAVANVMLDRIGDNRSDKKKLHELGVAPHEYQAWLRDPVYQSYIRTRAEAMLGDSLHESHLALIERVRSGDISAIKYFNEITGRYNPNAGDKADVNSVIMLIVEVIQRHVHDPKLLQLLADDISLIAGGVTAVSGGGGEGGNRQASLPAPQGVTTRSALPPPAVKVIDL